MILGVPTPEFPAEKTDRHASRSGASAHRERAAELNRQRFAHSRGQGPAPEAQPVDSATLNQVAGALR